LLLIGIALIGLLLAYANGANDTFKGVATLFGSKTTSYLPALLWATATTAMGSATALVLARGLLTSFSGKGLLPPEVISDPVFPAAVALSAGLTVLLATRLGFPISTTHALIGAIVGAGLTASSTGVNMSRLASGFILPLLTSPFIAISLAAVLYPRFRQARIRLGVSKETCVCVGGEIVGVVPDTPGCERALSAVRIPALVVGTEANCQVRYNGHLLGVSAGRALDGAHFMSAGAVSFARGLNDTPKIAALLLVGDLVLPNLAIIGVGVFMALGGLLSAGRVAETMSHRVTEMNPGQGFTANIVTSLLVIGASKLGMPVSTTHVSIGSLFGIGMVTRQAHWQTIRNILLAWIITLPVAGVLAAISAMLLSVLL
jgi:inorganic phosphate transporter, PiT family